MVINNFRLDKKFDAKKNSELLIKFTNKFLSTQYMTTNLKIISDKINIPNDILQKECKHYRHHFQ